MEGASISEQIPKSKLVTFWMCCFGLFLIKLWLIGHNEIVARYMPHDQSWFLRAAENILAGRWLGPYNSMTLIRQPGYPLWIVFAHLTSIPLRIASELLLLFSAGVFSIAWMKTRLSIWAAIIIFAAIAFHPASIRVTNEMESETLYAPALLMYLSGCVFLCASKRLRSSFGWSIFNGFWLAILWNTRHENVLLLLYVFFWAAFLFGWQRRRGFLSKNWLSLAAHTVGIPLLIVMSSVFLLRLGNLQKYGLFATSEMFAPGFSEFNRALLQIEAGDARPYVPLNEAMRKVAYSISPQFKKIEMPFEEKAKPAWTAHSCRNIGVCDDVIGGLVVWALRDAVSIAGFHSSAQEAERFYNRVAIELSTGCERGKYRCSKKPWAILGFAHPKFSMNFINITKSFENLVRMFIESDQNFFQKDNLLTTSPELRQAYDRVANRRAAWTQPERVYVSDGSRVEGWVYGYQDPIIRVLLRDSVGKVLGVSSFFMPRPDVRMLLKGEGEIDPPLNSGFSIDVNASEANIPADLIFVGRSGQEFVIPLSLSSNFSSPIAYAVDALQGLRNADTRREVAMGLGKSYGKWVSIGTALALIAILLLLAFRLWQGVDPLFFGFSAMLFLVISTRVALFTVFDASSAKLNVGHIRYLYPVVGIYSSLIIAWVFTVFPRIFGEVRTLWSKR